MGGKGRELGRACVQLPLQRVQGVLRRSRLRDRLSVELRGALKRVESRHRVVDRGCAEKDCDGIGLTLLVNHT